MDDDSHQGKHTHISCGLIFLFASSRGEGRFIWKDGNEGGEVLARLQFLFPIRYSPFFFSCLDTELHSLLSLTFLSRGICCYNEPGARERMVVKIREQ